MPLFALGLIIVIGIFASTLPQPQVLGRIEVAHLAREIALKTTDPDQKTEQRE